MANKDLEILEPGKIVSVEWYHINKLKEKDGNYSARIVAEVIRDKKAFIIISEKAFKYPHEH